MKKTILASAAIATIVFASIGDAEAQRRGRGNVGAAIGLGVLGGVIAGAAIANSRPAYAEPVYVVPRNCVAHQEFWSERRQAYIVRRVRVPC